MALLRRIWPWRLTRQEGPTSIDPLVNEYQAIYGGSGGRPERLAERVAAASRCLQLTAQNLGALRLRFSGSYRPAWVDDPMPEWLNHIGEAIAGAAYQYYRWGDAVLLVTSRYADSGYPRSWAVLDSTPGILDIRSDGNGGRAYISNGVRLRSRDVLQIGRQPGPGLRSPGALEAHWAAMNSANAADTLAASTFNTGGMPHIVLKPTRRVNEAQARELQDSWVSRVAARYGAAPAVVPPDVNFEKISWSPKELMLLELREFDTRQIASAFGVPAMLLNAPVTGGLTYQNPSALFDFWWRSELRPTARRFDAALSARLLPAGNYVKFMAGDLTEPDQAEHAEMMSKLLDQGVVTIDEVRAAVLDLPPLAAGPQLDEPAGTGTSPALAPPRLTPVPALGET